MQAFRIALLLLVAAWMINDSEGWGNRRRRRPRYPCNWNRWGSWSFNCASRCSSGTAYRYRYGTVGSYCIYRGWQRTTQSCGSKGCQQACSGGRCYCRSGYRLATNRKTCNDIDECNYNNGRGPCQTRCQNKVGTYQCHCNTGYYTCYTTRCCPVQCGRPRVPTSCPSSSYKDSQSLSVCRPLPTQSHCSTVYPNRCNLICPTYYSLASYSSSSPFFRYWPGITTFSSYQVRCQANAQWTQASSISRLYCRRNNDPPERVTLSSTTINEHSPVGTTVGYLSTYDPNVHDTHAFTIRPSSAAIFFNIIGNRLVITFVPKFNHHQGITGDGNSFTIILRVSDRGSPIMYKDQQYTIRILDANEAPEKLKLSSAVIREDAKVGVTIGTFTAFDPDSPSLTNPCTWAIVGFNTGVFKISGNKLLVAKSLNYEAQNNHPLQVACTDFGRPAATTVETFVIDVKDANDPPISLTLSNSQVDEDAISGKVVGVLVGEDQDQENLRIDMVAGLRPAGVTGDGSNRFQVSPASCILLPQKDQVKARTRCTANLTVQPKVKGAALGSPGSLDFETASWFQLVFFARDATHPSLHKSLYVNVTINNVNEAPTAITINNQSIPESAPGGSVVSSLVITDPDNSQRVVQRPSCVLASGGDNAFFAITGESPNMVLELAQTTKLDYESKRTYGISVTCNDHGLPPKTITRSFTISVTNVNEAPQNITLSNQFVPENAKVGTTIGMFATIDQDAGNTFTYSFPSGVPAGIPLAIVGNKLQVTGPLDYETNDTYAIDVASKDQGGLEVVTSFLISVQDVPEPPTALTLDGAHTIPENSTDGQFVGNLIVTDEDVNEDPSCTVSGGADAKYFKTNGDSGLSLVASSTASMLNYEKSKSNRLTVTVTCMDLDGLGITRSFKVNVTDVNEPPTDITIDNTNLNENLPANTLIGTLSVADPDLGQAHNCSVIDTQPKSGVPLLTTQFYVKNLKLYSKVSFDYEQQQIYSVEIECSDLPTDGQPSFTYDKPIVVNIRDVNEVPGSPCQPFMIAENKPDSTMVAMLNATDPDNEAVDKQVLMYAVVNSVPFKVDTATNQLVKNGPLDYETQKSYNVDIKVTDDGVVHKTIYNLTKVAPLSKTYTCVVNVEDANDPHVSASIRMVPPNATINEHATPGTVIATIVTDDKDATAKHFYSIVEKTVPFKMVGDKLTVTAQGASVDFEVNSMDISFTMVSRDEHNHSASRILSVAVTDVNEKATKLCLLGSTVQENKPAGYQIGQLVVEDPDYPQRSCSPIAPHTELPFHDKCVIVDQTADQIYSKRFMITSTLGLVQKMPLNFETYQFYDLRINCQDKNQPLNFVSNTFTVTVSNVNEAPTNLTIDATAAGNMAYKKLSATMYQVYIPEHVYNVGVLSFSVMDPDSTKQALVTYSVSGQNVAGTFEMRNNMLYLLSALDHEGTKQYTLQVVAQDRGSPPLSTKITVKVNITDMPDRPTQVHFQCENGALFNLVEQGARKRRAATNASAPLPTFAPVQAFNATWGSKDDCSVLTNKMVTPGRLIGKIFPADQDVYKWYMFTLTGASAGLFELAPYGKTQGKMWQAAYLRLSAMATASAAKRFNLTAGSPSYRLRVQVVDQWGMHEIGQYMSVKTQDACYEGTRFCSSRATCTLDATASSGYTCKCPPHYIGDGITSNGGCKACLGTGETVINGKCVNINECNSSPCLNGGTCTDGAHEFTCTCSAAFTGARCETKTGTCVLQPGICLNGGTCMDTKDDILCKCMAGYTGYFCDQQTQACASFPSNCEVKDTAAWCAATPAIGGESSSAVCVTPSQTTHIVLESACIPTNTQDSVYMHRAAQYIEDSLNNPTTVGQEDFCKYHTQQSQSSGGIQVSGRKKRATSLSSKQYVVRSQQSIFLKKGHALLSVVVLDSSSSYAAADASVTCKVLETSPYMHCVGYTDCLNFTLSSLGFKCGRGAYTVQLKDQGISPQSYVQLFVEDQFVTLPPLTGKNFVQHDSNAKAPQINHNPAASDPFYKTPVGIAVIAVACILAIALVVVLIYFPNRAKKVVARYDDRLLHSNYDGASSSGSQVSLGDDEFRGRFTDARPKSQQGRQAVGMTNPLYEATVASGNIQEASGVVECENALYESPDAIREMSEDMDN